MRHIRIAVCAMAAAVALPNAASAVPIFMQGLVTTEIDILNVGTLVSANNLGGGAVPVTVNGVAFGNDASMLSGMFAGFGDFSSQFTFGSPLDNLFSGLHFQGGGSSSLTLNGLTAGADYVLQLFLANSVNQTGWQSRVTVQGHAFNMANLGGVAQYIRVGFEASSATELISFGNGSFGEPDRMVLNGYALSTDQATAPVPEPASLALVGAGLVGAAWLRRRRRESGLPAKRQPLSQHLG